MCCNMTESGRIAAAPDLQFAAAIAQQSSRSEHTFGLEDRTRAARDSLTAVNYLNSGANHALNHRAQSRKMSTPQYKDIDIFGQYGLKRFPDHRLNLRAVKAPRFNERHQVRAANCESLDTTG